MAFDTGALVVCDFGRGRCRISISAVSGANPTSKTVLPLCEHVKTPKAKADGVLFLWGHRFRAFFGGSQLQLHIDVPDKRPVEYRIEIVPPRGHLEPSADNVERVF